MAGKNKSQTRTRITQKLDRRACQPVIERRVQLADGEVLAIAHVNGVYLLARFDKHERPLDARPVSFEGRNGQHRAYLTASSVANRTVLPLPKHLRTIQ